jgi:hypothetical protein
LPKGPVRRSQLIAPFGAGAMLVVKGGTSLISCGLDHWYKRESGDNQKIDPEEFVLEEWRLQRLLKVSHFRLPPDFRENRLGENVPNSYLTVPFLRFPQWHLCPRCNRLERLPLTVREKKPCDECRKKGKIKYLTQVRFIAMCDHGHLQDFPWREWVHFSARPECAKPLRLIATGGASLAAQKVKCDCGAERTLANITEATTESTYLTDNLEKGADQFRCQGKRPWLGTEEGEPCDRPLRGSLRDAANVWFSQSKSAIYVPRGNDTAPSELVRLLQEYPISTFIKLLSDAGADIKPSQLRKQYRLTLEPFSDAQLEAALRIIQSDGTDDVQNKKEAIDNDDSETEFRRAEFDILRTPRNEDLLLIKPATLDAYEPDIARYFSRVMLVHKLRETRVLAGFTRVFGENELTFEQHKTRLWRTLPDEADSWLPAYIVYGEGIFLEFNEDRLREWESMNSKDLARRIRPLVASYQKAQQTRKLRDKLISPRFILLHTFTHLLMNRLIFECGYSSAALRERLYVSDNPNAPMAGVLIYTAAGDAEGTLGGLVRMGKAGYLEPVIRRAVEGAGWCSADPVCMEMGSGSGQGPDSCNLAACHNCALVPETACEEFNRFLDRGVVVGELNKPDLGYFV